jgi:hypothetical protein
VQGRERPNYLVFNGQDNALSVLIYTAGIEKGHVSGNFMNTGDGQKA